MNKDRSPGCTWEARVSITAGKACAVLNPRHAAQSRAGVGRPVQQSKKMPAAPGHCRPGRPGAGHGEAAALQAAHSLAPEAVPCRNECLLLSSTRLLSAVDPEKPAKEGTGDTL